MSAQLISTFVPGLLRIILARNVISIIVGRRIPGG